MRRIWRKAKPKLEKRFRSNAQITAPFVFLISEDGEQVGKTPISEALERAKDLGLDLIEVNPKEDLPIVKIMDFGQFKYEKEKKAHKQKVQQKKVETKGLRLSVRIGKHDLKMRVDQAVKFFKKGHKLRLELILKGRERAHPEKAVEIFKEFEEELNNIEGLNIIREQDLTRQGGRFTMVLLNKSDQ